MVRLIKRTASMVWMIILYFQRLTLWRLSPILFRLGLTQNSGQETLSVRMVRQPKDNGFFARLLHGNGEIIAHVWSSNLYQARSRFLLDTKRGIV